MEEVDVVVAGAGSNGAAEEGALAVVRKRFKIVRIGGASAGSINAVGIAAGVQDLSGLWSHFLSRGDLEDWHLPGPMRYLGWLRSRPRYGLMAGQRIYAALREVLGSTRMCELQMPCRVMVGNLWKRKLQVVDSQLGLVEIQPGGKVKVVDASVRMAYAADVVRASSAIPGLMDAWQLIHDDPRLYTDGGVGANAPSGVWDDVPARRTISIRFVDDEAERPVVGPRSFLQAIFDLRQDAANTTFPSVKHNLLTIEIPTPGSGVDFSLTKEEVMRRKLVGVEAARKALGLK